MVSSKQFFTGLTSVDKSTGGFLPGELIIIGGRPAMGCTSLALSLLFSAEEEVNYLYMNLKESSSLLISRIRNKYNSLESAVEVKTNSLSPHFTTLSIENRNHILCNIEEPSLLELMETISQVIANHPIQAVIVDSFHWIGQKHFLLFEKPKKYESYLRNLKMLAVAIQKPIILTSGLHRKVEKKTHRKGVKLSKEVALSYYGCKERVADWVMLLFRWSYYGIEYDLCNNVVTENDAQLIIAKRRRLIGENPRLLFDYQDGVFRSGDSLL